VQSATSLLYDGDQIVTTPNSIVEEYIPKIVTAKYANQAKNALPLPTFLSALFAFFAVE